jgi:DNA-binding NtrC family response regulator
VDKFLADLAREYGKPKKGISDEALESLKQADWTGNIRQLRNVVERLTIMSGAEITAEEVDLYM